MCQAWAECFTHTSSANSQRQIPQLLILQTKKPSPRELKERAQCKASPSAIESDSNPSLTQEPYVKRMAFWQPNQYRCIGKKPRSVCTLVPLTHSTT